MTAAPSAAAAPTPPQRPALRRLPAPACEPPYDDEVMPAAHRGWRSSRDQADVAVQGTLALAFVLPSGVPAVPVLPPDLRLVPQPTRQPDAQEDLDEAEFGPQPTGRGDLPEPHGWSARLVQAIVEVLAGHRPVAQLVRWTTVGVYDELTALTPATGGRTRAALPLVRSVHVSEPADGVAEVAAMVRRGNRTTAIALRLEGLDGRWQCTAVELG